MNVYRCVSQELTWYDTGWNIPEGTGVPEQYCIAELVAAESRGRAKWLAWKSDSDFTGHIVDMPKFSIVVTRKDVDVAEGIVAKWKPAWWHSKREICAAWKARR